MKHILRILIAALLCLQATSEAFQPKAGDVYVWNRQDLLTMTRSNTRVTVVDTIASDSLPADSGKVWRLMVEPASAAPDTLMLFVFSNGGMRWSRGSASFPVEFESPLSVGDKWLRGGKFWGLPKADSILHRILDPSYPLAPYDTGFLYYSSEKDGRSTVSGYLQSIGDRTTNYATTKLENCEITGIWTDSVGPLWFSGGTNRYANAYLTDWSLVSVNGKPVSTIAPRWDSIENFLPTLANRKKLIRYPNPGDVFSWRYTYEMTIEGTGTTQNTIISTVEIESLPDSAKWVRRTLRMSESFSKDSVKTWSETCRWDSVGQGKCSNSMHSFISQGWSVNRTDSIFGDTAYRRSTDFTTNTVYLPTGELVRGLNYYRAPLPANCGLTCSVYYQPLTITRTYVLLSSPDYTVATTPRPTVVGRHKLDARVLQSLLATDPSASVRWTTLSGRSGKQTLSDFMKSSRRFGALWLQVRTSKGDVKEGLVVQTR